MQDSLIGTVLDGRYKILSVIGEGTTGIVFKALHQMMDQPVAVKMLRALFLSDSDAHGRFQQEAKAVGSLSHPNIIAVHDFGESADKIPFLVMDFLEGNNLREELGESNGLPAERVVNISLQICAALTHAHERGVIHRDIKPTNIMLVKNNTGDDIAKVVDFGMSKFLPESGREAEHLTQTGSLQGDPLYMSPEQFLGRQLDVRSDIYSLGCVIYKSLTGCAPFENSQLLEVMRLHITSSARTFQELNPRLHNLDNLEEIVFKALKKNPDDRYQSAAEMHAALQSLADKEDGRKFFPRKASKPKLLKTMRAAASQFWLPLLLAGMVGLAWLAFTDSGHIECVQLWLTIQKARREPPDQIESTLAMLSDLYEGKQDWKNLSRTLKELISLADKHSNGLSQRDAELRFRLADSYLNQNDKENARVCSDQAYSLVINDYEQQTTITALRAETKLIARLIVLLEQVGDVPTPELQNSYYCLGKALNLTDNPQAAERAFARAVQICDSPKKLPEHYRCTDALLALSCSRKLSGDDTGARLSFERYLRAVEDEPQQRTGGLSAYATACARVKQYAEAIKWRLQAMKLLAGKPDRLDYLVELYSLAECYRESDLHEKALPCYVEVVNGMEQLKWQQPHRYLHYVEGAAKEYEKLGKTIAADSYYKRIQDFRDAMRNTHH